MDGIDYNEDMYDDEYNTVEGPPGMKDFMGGDPFEDYTYDDLAKLYEQYADDDKEMANMLLYGMQMKMQKSGQHSSIGNQYYKELDIDEMFETKSCISSSVQQQVLSVGSVVLWWRVRNR